MTSSLVSNKLETALGLLDDGIDLLRCRLRREQPDLKEAQLDELIAEWLNPVPGHLTGSAASHFRLRQDPRAPQDPVEHG